MTEKEAHMKKLQFEQEQQFVAKALKMANAQTLSAGASATSGIKRQKAGVSGGTKVLRKFKKKPSSGTGGGVGRNVPKPGFGAVLTPKEANTENGKPATPMTLDVTTASDEDENFADTRESGSPVPQADGARLTVATDANDTGSNDSDGGPDKLPNGENNSLDLDIEPEQNEEENQSANDSLNGSGDDTEPMDSVEREKRKKNSPVRPKPANRSSKRKKKAAASNKPNDNVSHTHYFTLSLPFSHAYFASSNLEVL